MRDLRHPQLLGEQYLELRQAGLPIETAVRFPVPDWCDDGRMSNDPGEHHSKVDQTQQHQEPSDERR